MGTLHSDNSGQSRVWSLAFHKWFLREVPEVTLSSAGYVPPTPPKNVTMVKTEDCMCGIGTVVGKGHLFCPLCLLWIYNHSFKIKFQNTNPFWREKVAQRMKQNCVISRGSEWGPQRLAQLGSHGLVLALVCSQEPWMVPWDTADKICKYGNYIQVYKVMKDLLMENANNLFSRFSVCVFFNVHKISFGNPLQPEIRGLM